MDDISKLESTGISEKVESMIDNLVQTWRDIETEYIAKCADCIAQIGKLNPTSVNELIIISDAYESLSEVNKMMSAATSQSEQQLEKIYKQTVDDTYHNPKFDRFLTQNPLSEQTKSQVDTFAKATLRQAESSMETLVTSTNVSKDFMAAVNEALDARKNILEDTGSGEFVNLTHTTAVNQKYKEEAAERSLAVASGIEDYSSSVRDAVKKLGTNGMQVYYQSGYHRRLDSAIRQNVIDTTNQITQQAAYAVGEELGWKCIELSAHLMSAPDHEPIQGRVFTEEQYNRCQTQQDFHDIDGNHYEAIRRPIKQWNCMHFAYPFDPDVSVRTWTDEQLQAMKDENDKGIELNGKHYTRYQGSQIMRKLETKIRRQKDIVVAAIHAQDDELWESEDAKLKPLLESYFDVSAKMDYRVQYNRIQVNGYKSYNKKS